jgi:hypothetical protein
MMHEAAYAVREYIAPRKYRWKPYPDLSPDKPHPQRLALESEADVVGYGGEAGAGKTDLQLGVAERHRRSIIFRNIYPALRDMIERSKEIFGTGYNEQLHLWRLDLDRTLEFASIPSDKHAGKYKGRPHDFYGFDELTDFSEATFRLVTAWNRSTYVDPFTGKVQRCRIVVTFNPPLEETGDWVTRYFLPWLAHLHPDVFDHPDPALPGEIRWFARGSDRDIEVDVARLGWYIENDGAFEQVESDTPITRDGELLQPLRGAVIDNEVRLARSRTFIPGRLADNPRLVATGYRAIIDGLPEPLRSLLKGQFGAGRVADPWRVIPRAWVLAAQERWRKRERPTTSLSAVGIDVARGGAAKTVLALIYDNWIDELEKYPGILTPDGPAVATIALPYAHARNGMFIDIIGVGGSVYDTLAGQDIQITGINFASSPPKYVRSRNGLLAFKNVRAAAYWLFREALDPDHGDDLALPDDPELLQELCEPRWTLTAQGILIEPKEDVESRIGRSPDSADALVIGHYGLVSQGTAGI